MPKIIIPTNKESLTTKRNLIFIGLTAVCGGYILFLAVLAPQQLAEAAVTATNVVCSGCVGSSDIADNSIRSVDIQNGQVGSVDIGAGQVKTGDIANNAIQPNVQRISAQEPIEAGTSETIFVDCPAGTVVTGGGYFTTSAVQVSENFPLEDLNTWRVGGQNTSPSTDLLLTAYALCIGPMP